MLSYISIVPVFGFTGPTFTGSEDGQVVNAQVTITNGVTLSSNVIVNCIPSVLTPSVPTTAIASELHGVVLFVMIVIIRSNHQKLIVGTPVATWC